MDKAKMLYGKKPLLKLSAKGRKRHRKVMSALKK